MIITHLPPTVARARLNTDRRMNRKIAERTMNNVRRYRSLSRKDISQRINELNYEWDTERTLEANFAIVSVVSSILGYAFNKKWVMFGGIASLFLLLHAVQGWCPPLTVIRRFGVRTVDEINCEKESLQKVLNNKNKGG